MVTRARKKFIVVAYDISNSRRRRRVVKLLERVGTRVNYSVFECMLSDAQYASLQHEIRGAIKPKEDQVAFYPICVDCYSKIVYQPERGGNYKKITVV